MDVNAFPLLKLFECFVYALSKTNRSSSIFSVWQRRLIFIFWLWLVASHVPTQYVLTSDSTFILFGLTATATIPPLLVPCVDNHCHRHHEALLSIYIFILIHIDGLSPIFNCNCTKYKLKCKIIHFDSLHKANVIRSHCCCYSSLFYLFLFVLLIGLNDHIQRDACLVVVLWQYE